jgi:hypothetical protein
LTVFTSVIAVAKSTSYYFPAVGNEAGNFQAVERLQFIIDWFHTLGKYGAVDEVNVRLQWDAGNVETLILEKPEH